MNTAVTPLTRILRTAALATAAITLAAFSVFAAGPAYAATVTVCATGCDYTSIQTAVANAFDGDTVEVGAGTYVENVTIDKSLTLRGPNVSTSPNTADPLTANSARSPEAIIQVPASDTLNAINLTSGAKTVIITGFTVDLTHAVYVTDGQRFLRGISAPADGTLTLTNNIFTGGAGAVEGTIVYKTTAGDTSVVVTNNRFTNGGLSNGLYVNNSATNANLDLTITGNVWLDNAYTAGNFSTDNGTTITGTIANNWLGNSTPGTSGVDNYDTRQAGFLFAGAYNGLHVTDNTFKDIEDVAIYFYPGFSGVVTFTGNVIDGYSNVSGRAAIFVRGTSGSDVSEVVFTGNAIDHPTAGSLAVLNQSETSDLDAHGNWWGTPTPDFDAIVTVSDIGHAEYSVLVDDWLTAWGDPVVAGSGGSALADTGASSVPETAILAFLLLLAGGSILLLTRKHLRRE